MIFSNGPTSSDNEPWIAARRSDLSGHADPKENVWHPFVEASSMIFGLYLLPHALGGDSTLTHEVDEINVVLEGRSRFTMGGDTIEVGPGSIVFVERGVGHFFSELDRDFEVLILFAKNRE